jgi:serine protease
MTLRRTVLSLLLAGACAPAFAGATIDFSAVNDATLSATPRFVIKYRAGSAERTQAAARQRSLDAAATRAQPQIRMQTNASGQNVGVHVSTLRATASGGMHVIKASQRLSRTEAEALMRSIGADPNVEYVAVDGRAHADALPNDPYLATYQAWHYGTGPGGARVTSAWDITKGAGIVVAVIDTGATHHVDLEPNLLPGYDFITDAFVSRRADDTRVPGGWDLGDWNVAGECGSGSSARNSSWHGTHVSGTIAEVTNNGIGGAGVAPDARIVPVRVLGRCGGYDSDIADAMVWAAGGTVPGVPNNPNPAEVLSLSLGGNQTCSQYMQDAINTAVSLGATVVVAAGNDNADASTHMPAGCQNVVTVGATGYSGQRASYSNYGPKVDLAAPGGAGVEGSPNGYVWSTLNAGTTVPGADAFAGYTGTSMATPHVSGVVALMQSVAPKPLTPAQVEGLLVSSARPFPVKPDKTIGSGILDATAAVQRAQTFGQPVSGRPLTSGVAEAVPPLATGQSLIYVIQVPAGATRLELLTYGGRGTVSAYAQYEAEPMSGSNIGASTRPGTNQTIVLNAPAAGHYYLKVTATADTAGVLVRATVR